MLRKRILSLTTRLMAVVLLVTFLGPGFGWQAVATHDELAHASRSSHDYDHHHHQDGDDVGSDDDAHHAQHDEVAHAQIGHLLSHLPLAVTGLIAASPATGPATGVLPVRQDSWAGAEVKPPFRPPRPLLFA